MNMCTRCGAEMKSGDRFCKKCRTGSETNHSLAGKKAGVLAEDRKWVRPAAITVGAVFVLLAAWLVYISLGGPYPVGDSVEGRHMGHGGHASVRHAGVAAENGVIKVPASSLSENGPRFFSYESEKGRINFILLKAPDGSIRAALDACNACYRAKLGYRFENGLLVCNNCGMTFRPENIGIMTGGCNPIPVRKTVETGFIALTVKDLEPGARFF